MADQDTPRSGSPLRATLVILFLLVAAGTVLYAASGNPLPSFLARYFYETGGPREVDSPPPLPSAESMAESASSSSRSSLPTPRPLPVETSLPSVRREAAPTPFGLPDPILPRTENGWPLHDDADNRESGPKSAVAEPPLLPKADTADSADSAPQDGSRTAADTGNRETDKTPDTPETDDAQPVETMTFSAAGPDAQTVMERHAGSENGSVGQVVVRYGKGRPVDGKPSVVRGRIERGAPSGLNTDDRMVGNAFIHDLAAFMADNYWPRGTHPFAQNGGITTAGLRWTNMWYGTRLALFGIDATELSAGRQKLLDYVFTPGMIRGLYRLHIDRFCNALEAAARSRMTEHGQLDESQCAELFAIYSRMAKGLSGCIRAYQRTPRIRALVALYAAASDRAAEDFMRYAAAMDGPPLTSARTAERYLESSLLREQQKNNLAAAMRRGGDTGGLDADSLVYAALWLHRRGEGRDAAFSAAAEICAACSTRLLELSRRYAP